MNTAIIIESTWHPEEKLLVTHLSGDADERDIEQWKASLYSVLNEIEDNATFKIFVNLHGFTAKDVEAHKRFRSIVPLTLANYGWKVGYVNLFEKEAAQMMISTTRGIRCIGAAHSHHDETKMSSYQSKFSNDREQYFTDPDEAHTWIRNLE